MTMRNWPRASLDLGPGNFSLSPVPGLPRPNRKLGTNSGDLPTRWDRLAPMSLEPASLIFAASGRMSPIIPNRQASAEPGHVTVIICLH